MDLLLSHYYAAMSQCHDMPAKNVNKSESPQWPSHLPACTRRHLIILGGFEAIFLFRKKKGQFPLPNIKFPPFLSQVSVQQTMQMSHPDGMGEIKNSQMFQV